MQIDGMLRSINRRIQWAADRGDSSTVWRFPLTVQCTPIQRGILVQRLQQAVAAMGYTTKVCTESKLLYVSWQEGSRSNARVH